MYKKMAVVITTLIIGPAVYAQFLGPSPALDTLNKRLTQKVATATGTQTAATKATAAKPSLSGNPQDPRLVTLNGQTYRLRKGRTEWEGTVEKQNGCTYVDGEVSIHTYKDANGNTITVCVHNSMQPGAERNPSDGYIAHQRAHDRPANSRLTAKEHPEGVGSGMEACESYNPDGSCNYTVMKSKQTKGQTQTIKVQQKIPAYANQADEKGRTYQAVRNANFQQTFGKVVNGGVQYEGTFGDETYYSR